MCFCQRAAGGTFDSILKLPEAQVPEILQLILEYIYEPVIALGISGI
jgi:hypothetical protein